MYLLLNLSGVLIINIHNNLGSDFEKDFLFEKLPKYASPFWFQLFELQRELENILRFGYNIKLEIEKKKKGPVGTFRDQKVDFSIEFPYPQNGQNGIILEIDGSQHDNDPAQRKLDSDRDIATEKVKWGKTVRIKTTDWEQIDEHLKFLMDFENESYVSILKQNFDEPLHSDNEGLIALRLTLIPFAIARIQKTIIHLIFEGKLNIDADEWNIAILERDIPCGETAIEDLKELICLLLKLEGETKKIPNINVFVEGNERYASIASGITKLESTIDKSKNYDLLIDISILLRSGLTDTCTSISADTTAIIRSAHSPKEYRKFKTTDLIIYKPLGSKDIQKDIFTEDTDQINVLEKLLQIVFRKTSFRQGQIEIINRALQKKNVIGLLPTGSGKSLTYQLTALLQPGIAVVIDPIKSLMKDQYEGLLKNGIDGVVYINSSLNATQKELSIDKVKNAQAIFAFISPERLQIEKFRDTLSETTELKNYFSYCVIDEAHCVSEWGHDFRTSYLRLGANARKFCVAKNEEFVPFFALTATASYDVLSDIQRELGIPDESSIIRLERLDRPEIQFKIIEVPSNFNHLHHSPITWNTKKEIGKLKQKDLILLLNDIPGYYDEFLNTDSIINEGKKVYNGADISLPKFKRDTFYNQSGRESNAGLIFCPHRKGYFGVMGNLNEMQKEFRAIEIGIFFASNDEEDRDEENGENQSNFINNKLKWLVATKAFGMGIDKPNIRFVIHFNFPGSIESYYQEAGRGGRDRKLAMGLILINRQKFNYKEKIETVGEDGEIKEIIEENLTSIDKNISLEFLRNNFKGIKKEKTVLAELLTEIRFPTQKITDSITDEIYEKFSIEVEFSVQINKNDRELLYINDKVFNSETKYGSIYLDLDNLPFYPDKNATPIASEIAQFIINQIREKKPVDLSPFEWLSQELKARTEPGIEAYLNNSEIGKSFGILISFTNDMTELITKLINGQLVETQKNIPEKVVTKALNFCRDSA